MQHIVDHNAEARKRPPITAPQTASSIRPAASNRSSINPDPSKKYFKVGTDPTGRSLAPAHNNADRMRMLFSTGAHLREGREEVNPMWHNFPDRCVTPIKSVDELKKLLKFHGQSDHVMVVRYWQEGCTACNALDKVFEWLCHEQKEKLPHLHFFDVQREAMPQATEGMLRYPQVKAFSGGQWADIDFKPPQDYREQVYNQVEKEVHKAAKRGRPVTALQAEEMYFSVAGPAVAMVLEDAVIGFYNSAQIRLHNYWGQVAKRRSWFFKTYIDPVGDNAETVARKEGHDVHFYSAFGETILPTVTTPSAAPHDVPNASPASLGLGMQ